MEGTADGLQENEFLARLAMETAINSDDPELLLSGIMAGADVNINLGNGWTPMHYAMDLAIDGMIAAIELIQSVLVQEYLDGSPVEEERVFDHIDFLKHINAKTKFICREPWIGPLPNLLLIDFDWAIVGGESGKGRARKKQADSQTAKL